MSNLNHSAFPTGGNPFPTGNGLTKHEWAACLIGAQMASRYNTGLAPVLREKLGTEAYLLAEIILNKFNPTQQ